MGLIPSKASGLRGYCLMLGKGLDLSTAISMGVADLILPISEEEFAHKESGIRDKKGSISPCLGSWSDFITIILHAGFCRSSTSPRFRTISPFCENEIWALCVSRKSLPSKCMGALSTIRNVWWPVSSPSWKFMGLDLKAVMGKFETPTIWIVSLLRGRGFFIKVGFKTDKVAPVSTSALVSSPFMDISISPRALVRSKGKTPLIPSEHPYSGIWLPSCSVLGAACSLCARACLRFLQCCLMCPCLPQ